MSTLHHGRINLSTARHYQAVRAAQDDPGELIDTNVVIASNAIRAAEKAQKTLIHAIGANPQVSVGSTELPLVTSHSQLRISAYLAKAGQAVLTRAEAHLMDRGLGGDAKSYITAEYGVIDPDVYTNERADQLLAVAEHAMAAVDAKIASQQRTTMLVDIVDRVYRNGV